ncbi:hypothetical protein ARMSODRAFT_962956 [Armillaria solidipes]|uniref:Uncharacterized protein n=1 Tax=Armillaria solidipes TaxID=1076256 RepID=A0A2H3B454_9AGAR|nr:hypothetical protein ARMSODRAFT_962956 [Armillaria solidipes]
MLAVPIIAGRSADDLDIVFTAVLRSRLGISDRSKLFFSCLVCVHFISGVTAAFPDCKMFFVV